MPGAPLTKFHFQFHYIGLEAEISEIEILNPLLIKSEQPALLDATTR